MNGAHDTGGQMGFGPVRHEANEPVFHADWERRMFALMSAVAGDWTLDEDRSACEAMPHLNYVTASYYEHWLHGLEHLLVAHGFANAEEIATGRAAQPAKHVTPTPASAVWPTVTARGSYMRDVARAARFKAGDKVTARRLNPEGHTRLPRYLRGHAGTIIRIHGAHVFPDSNSCGEGEDPQWLYTVEFKGSEVWGTATTATICADLWEPYLETR